MSNALDRMAVRLRRRLDNGSLTLENLGEMLLLLTRINAVEMDGGLSERRRRALLSIRALLAQAPLTALSAEHVDQWQPWYDSLKQAFEESDDLIGDGQ